MKVRKIIPRVNSVSSSQFEAGKWYMGISEDWKNILICLSDKTFSLIGIPESVYISMAVGLYSNDQNIVRFFVSQAGPPPYVKFKLYKGQHNFTCSRVYGLKINEPSFSFKIDQ
jgi:hypothetical protein